MFYFIEHTPSLYIDILGPLDTTINCWCIVMQFADIDAVQMVTLNRFCRVFIGFIQCDYCWNNGCNFCCNCFEIETAEIPTEKMGLEDNMSHTISMTMATISEQVMVKTDNISDNGKDGEQSGNDDMNVVSAPSDVDHVASVPVDAVTENNCIDRELQIE